jgi:hypothetical protein
MLSLILLVFKFSINKYYDGCLVDYLRLDGFVNVDAKIFTGYGTSNCLISQAWRWYQRGYNVICKNFLKEINIFQNCIESRWVHTAKSFISRSKHCEWSYKKMSRYSIFLYVILLKDRNTYPAQKESLLNQLLLPNRPMLLNQYLSGQLGLSPEKIKENKIAIRIQPIRKRVLHNGDYKF